MNVISKFIINGKEYSVVAAEETPVVDDFEYDSEGWSLQSRHGVCRQNKFINAFLDEKIANGEEWEKRVASESPRWFAIWRKKDNLTPEQQRVFLRSYRQNKSVYMVGAMTGAMYVVGYYPTATDELTDVYPEKAENCAIPIFGFRPDYVPEVFVSKYPRILKNEMARAKPSPQVGQGNWS